MTQTSTLASSLIVVLSALALTAPAAGDNYVDWEDTAYVHVLASGNCSSACPPSDWPGDILGPRAQMGGTPASFSYDYTCCNKSAGIKSLISSGASTSIFAGIYSAHSTGGSALFEQQVDVVVGAMAGSYVAAAFGFAAAWAPDFPEADGTTPGARVRSGTGGAPSAAGVFAGPGEQGAGGSAFLLVSIYPERSGTPDVGDFDNNGGTDVFDITMLQDVIAAGVNSAQYDLDGDSDLDADDLEYWLSAIADTVPGDTNFDRRVNTTDLANLAAYMNRAGAWSVGDFNRHSDTSATLGLVTVADYAILAAHDGYDGTSAALAVLPEPCGCSAASLIAAALLSRRKRHW